MRFAASGAHVVFFSTSPASCCNLARLCAEIQDTAVLPVCPSDWRVADLTGKSPQSLGSPLNSGEVHSVTGKSTKSPGYIAEVKRVRDRKREKASIQRDAFRPTDWSTCSAPWLSCRSNVVRAPTVLGGGGHLPALRRAHAVLASDYRPTLSSCGCGGQRNECSSLLLSVFLSR